MMKHFLMESPLGILTLVSTDGVLSGLYMPEHLRGPKADSLGPRTMSGFDLVRAELSEYFDLKRREFTFPVAPEGTPFQQRVWEMLRDIPYGETCTYGQLADALGNRAAIRAVGLANGRNPVSIVIPCHRVLGSDGSLTGYAGGLARKQFLLEMEGARLFKQISLL
jgi:methylated-DNA-[protein]-cysteine S-methyltransferase